MSNPTELPDLIAEKANFEAWAGVKYRNVDTYTILDHDRGWQAWCERARRAQSNGKASQVDALYKQYLEQWPPVSSGKQAQSGPVAWVYECRQPGDDKDNWAEFFSRNKPSDEAYIRNTRPLYAPAATLSSLCGAQHAESGKVAKPDLTRIRDEVDWKNGLTHLLEDYKHATDHGIMSRESVQARVIDYVLTQPVLAAQQAAAPGPAHETIVREGDNLVCTACGTSAPGTPEAPKGYQIVPITLPEQLVDQLASATYDLDDAAREIVREDWGRALGMLRAAQLDGGQEGSAT